MPPAPQVPPSSTDERPCPGARYVPERVFHQFQPMLDTPEVLRMTTQYIWPATSWIGRLGVKLTHRYAAEPSSVSDPRGGAAMFGNPPASVRTSTVEASEALLEYCAHNE